MNDEINRADEALNQAWHDSVHRGKCTCKTCKHNAEINGPCDKCEEFSEYDDN